MLRMSTHEELSMTCKWQLTTSPLIPHGECTLTMDSQTKRYILFTWGCQMNEDDSEQISSMLMRMGMSPTQDPEIADVAILVTCSVREKPENKALSKLGELNMIKERRPWMVIGVCGCMAQRKGRALRKAKTYIDFIVGTHNLSQIPELIYNAQKGRKFASALDMPREHSDEKRLPGRVSREEVGLKCFVPIMYGCDNFCSYCIVPHVRGRERSRKVDAVISEVAELASRGCKEITLLGQNVNSYSDLDIDFPKLLGLVNDIDGIQRIRFITSHPKDLSDELIRAIAVNDKVCEHIHLAVQSGDDRILQAMNRRYTVEHLKNRITSLRTAIPDIAISTDFIAGFPGETQEEFENTLRLVEDVRFDSAFMFAFNAIPGTKAAELPDQLPVSVKNERLNRLIKLQNEISCSVNEEMVGQTYEVLVEGRSHKDNTKATGLTRQAKTMNFTTEKDFTGQMVAIRAIEGHLYGYVGEIL